MKAQTMKKANIRVRFFFITTAKSCKFDGKVTKYFHETPGTRGRKNCAGEFIGSDVEGSDHGLMAVGGITAEVLDGVFDGVRLVVGTGFGLYGDFYYLCPRTEPWTRLSLTNRLSSSRANA